jgi:asparagine synthase (glutamine-hydrolysing)
MMRGSILYNDQLTYLSSVLDRQDKMSMSYSVEARVPYCHQDLYRLINPILSKYLIHRGERKAILKKCASKYLSDSLVYRRKNGLRLPLGEWYSDPKLVGRYLDILTDQSAKDRAIYNHKAIAQVVKKFRQGHMQYTKQIVSLVNLELWHRVCQL